MRYLFIAFMPYPQHNAVFNIALSVARCLVAQGHGVTLLEHSGTPEAARREETDGIQIRRFHHARQARARKIWQACKDGGGKKALLAALLRSPGLWGPSLYRALTGVSPAVGGYAREISALCRREGYDAAVSFSAPYQTALALARANTGGAKKVVYMADPYATHYQMGGAKAIRQEAFVLRRVDAALIAPDLASQYPHLPALAPFCDKITPLEFPCLSPRPSRPYEGFAAGRVNLLYAGNFYADIRPAEEMLFLAQAIQEPRILLTLMGDFLPRLKDDAQRALAAALIERGALNSLPPQPAEAAYGAMEEADILLSIGNAIPHMVPSKLLDYIGTGRPIVHVARRGDDPALPILENYPLHLSLVAAGGRLGAGQAEELARFCLQNKGRLLDKRQVYSLYSNYTAQHAAAVLARTVRKDGAP